MSLSRRNLLKLIASGVIGHTFDLDRLLWVPGQKTIFIPEHSHGLSVSQIVAVEMDRIMPGVLRLFERDDIFYKLLDKKLHLNGKPYGEMKVPLEYRPNHKTSKISE